MIARMIALLAGALLTAAAAAAADGEYLLQPGDVVEISVAGMPALRERSPVQLDGRLSFPLVGELDAAGQTIDAVRERVRTALASRLVPFYALDGSELMRSLDRSQIGAVIAEYRPIFVAGDVLRAGELAFRPGITARQAVAAAGGAAVPLVAPTGDARGLRADYAAAWYELASDEVRIWRLRGELGSPAAFDDSTLPAAPDPAALPRLLDLEEQLRAAEAHDHDRQKAFLATTTAQLDAQTEVLKRQLEAERQSEATDAEALAAAVELSESAFSRSRQAQMDDMTRLADLRGAALVSATRRLQTESNLMALERRRTEVAREAEELEDALRVRWLSELREAEQSRAVNRARIDSVIERLAAAGLAAGGQRGAAAPELTLVRDGRTMPVADDVRLQPGDLLEVRWRTSTGADPATTDARSLHWPAVAVR